MATIKSYTDLSQSKTLSKILPLKSADMYFHNRSDISDNYPLPIEWKHNNPLLSQEIPCWSLAALLNILLPKGTRLLQSSIDDTYHCDCPKAYVDKWSDNLVDACYELILKLNELKLL